MRRLLPPMFMCLGLALAFALHVSIARMLGSGAAYGQFAFYRSVAMIVALFAALGLPGVLLRQTASRRSQQDQHAALLQESNTIIQLQLWATLALAAVGSALILLFVPSEELALASCCLVLGLASAWQMTGEQLARGLKQFVTSQFAFRVLLPALAMFLAALWWANSGALLPIEALAAMTIASIVVAMFLWMRGQGGLAGLLHEQKEQTQQVRGNSDFQHALSGKSLLAAGLPMLVISGLGILMNQLDVLMLRPLAGDQVTGQYSAAASIAVAVSAPLMAVNIFSGTFYAEQHGLGDVEAMNRGARRYMRFILPLSLVAGGVLALVSPWLLSMFGQGFADARVVVSLLIAGQLVNAAAGSCAAFLCMTGQERACTIIFACGALLNVLLNCLLIPHYSAAGAATATAISLAFWNIGAVMWMRRTSGVDTSLMNFIWPPRRGSVCVS